MAGTLVSDRQVLTATPVQIDQARDVVASLADHEPRDPVIKSRSGEAVAMPRELATIVTRILEILSSGGTVTVGAMPEMLTTTAAASVLGVSRPTLMKLIERKDLAAHKVGSHSRLRTEDVLALRAVRLAKQRAAFDELRAIEDEDGQ